jgi:hypothetical protein
MCSTRECIQELVGGSGPGQFNINGGAGEQAAQTAEPIPTGSKLRSLGPRDPCQLWRSFPTATRLERPRGLLGPEIYLHFRCQPAMSLQVSLPCLARVN